MAGKASIQNAASQTAPPPPAATPAASPVATSKGVQPPAMASTTPPPPATVTPAPAAPAMPQTAISNAKGFQSGNPVMPTGYYQPPSAVKRASGGQVHSADQDKAIADALHLISQLPQFRSALHDQEVFNPQQPGRR